MTSKLDTRITNEVISGALSVAREGDTAAEAAAQVVQSYVYAADPSLAYKINYLKLAADLQKYGQAVFDSWDGESFASSGYYTEVIFAKIESGKYARGVESE